MTNSAEASDHLVFWCNRWNQVLQHKLWFGMRSLKKAIHIIEVEWSKCKTMQNKTPGQPICTLRAHTRKVDIPLSSLQIIY